jgi:hypothetical protein
MIICTDGKLKNSAAIINKSLHHAGELLGSEHEILGACILLETVGDSILDICIR